ncbi:hypothetical protein DRB96_25815 [Streptomyces sp. ICC1]|nr:hypothetical protein DRB89_26450 [Streptomyces sp. ICC4]AWZ15107.1 hypothetical protein DRB96_25815 [Streptomyces sp. ICC1]
MPRQMRSRLPSGRAGEWTEPHDDAASDACARDDADADADADADGDGDGDRDAGARARADGADPDADARLRGVRARRRLPVPRLCPAPPHARPCPGHTAA